MAAGEVVVVGAGQAGAETAGALRARGYLGGITLVGDEGTAPYERPPLSKEFLAGTTTGAELRLRAPSFWRERRIRLLPDDPAVALDRESKSVQLRSGTRLPYTALVLATGASPRLLPVPGADLPGVLTLRGLADALALRRSLRAVRRLVVVGGGFVGLELAASVRRPDRAVTVVEAAPQVLGRSVSAPVAACLTRRHRQQGVRILTGTDVRAVQAGRDGRAAAVALSDGSTVPADLVVVAVGALPRVTLAADAELTTGGGVLVDDQLRTNDRAVRAVGDCARFPDPEGPGTLRLESVQNATAQARFVAAALCGAGGRYREVPWFWTEQYELRVQMAGIGGERAVLSGDRRAGRFSVFRFDGDRLRSVESVNRPADHVISRRLLAAGTGFPTPDEVAAEGFDLRRLASRRPVGA